MTSRRASGTSLTLSGPVSGGGYDWNIHGPGNLTVTGEVSSVNTVALKFAGSLADKLTVSGTGSLSAATILVEDRGVLMISDGGSVIASYAANVNHLLTVTGTNSSLSASMLNVFRPAHYDDAPKVEVTNGGTLTASSIAIDTSGVGGSWVVVSATGTIDTPSVQGDGTFNFNGGELVNTAGGGAKTNIDILALVFTNGGSYSLEPSEVLITSELLGRHDAVEGASEGTFTFNGGTLQCRPDPRGLPGYIGVTGQILTHVYVNASSTIGLNMQELDVYSPLEGEAPTA